MLLLLSRLIGFVTSRGGGMYANFCFLSPEPKFHFAKLVCEDNIFGRVVVSKGGNSAILSQFINDKALNLKLPI